MKAEIIAVGNEVVTGHTINTNASTIASLIKDVGIMTYYHSAVCDVKEDIEDALAKALTRADVIILSGGLGFKKDDLTKEAVCHYLNKELVMNEKVLSQIKSYFEKVGKEMTDKNKKQALFPREAYLLDNDYGTALGCILKVEDRFIVLLPGLPKELKPMLKHYVMPYFKALQKEVYYTMDIRLFGIDESVMVEKIEPLLGVFEWGTIAPYVGSDEVIIRVTARAKDEKEACNRAEIAKKHIVNCLKEYVIGYNEEKIEEKIMNLLQKKQYKIATAESCTGGLVAATLVGCSGISDYFGEGIVTYSNEAKRKYLGVKEETLRQFGAVSEETAREMAEGIKRAAESDIGLSTTGIAGPGGGTHDKPVGLVYIGIALKEQTYVYKLNLNGDRQTVREHTVKSILFHLYKLLK